MSTYVPTYVQGKKGGFIINLEPTHRYNFYISTTKYERLKHMAKVQDKNISFIINQFIDKGIRDSDQPPAAPLPQLPIISYMVINNNNSQTTAAKNSKNKLEKVCSNPKRKDFIFLFKKILYGRIEFGKELKEENRSGITVTDFCNLLESSRSYHEETKKNRSNKPFTGPITQTQAQDSGKN